MKREMHGHIKGLASFKSERHIWKIHSDTSTDHSSLLYFLLGIVPTPALTLALSLSLVHSLLPSLSFASLQNHKTLSCTLSACCTLRACISEPHAAFRPRITFSLHQTHTHWARYVLWTTLRKRRTQTAAGPRSWKWFYSFNIISLNNDNTARLPPANQMHSIVMCFQTTVLRMGNVSAQINGQSSFLSQR